MDVASSGPASVARRLLEEVLNHGRLDLIEELVAEDAVEHEPLPIATGEMRNDLRTWLTELRSAFPDYHVHIEDVVTEGEKVAIRERITGTNLGSLLGVPPTGRPMSIDGFDLLRVHDGRIVEHWGLTDGWAMAHQLGLAAGAR